MRKYEIICVIGTRPEALKMVSVIEKLSKFNSFNVRTVVTGQHKELIGQILIDNKINVDSNFKIMVDNQSLSSLNASLLTKFEIYLKHTHCDMLIAQGDTMSTMVAALTAFYLNIPFAHVEAGLRTSDIKNPFPEEFNRRIVTMIADLHFCPTQLAKDNLSKENITKGVYVTGNTIIDLLKKYNNNCHNIPHVFNSCSDNKKTILVTCHRRENLGQPLFNICLALKEIAKKYQDIEILFPVHPNPSVKKIVEINLQGISNIKLVEPLNYHEMIAALNRCYLVLTDSGGLQEEAPALKKPVLILRNHTERQEGVTFGVTRLVGTENTTIMEHVDELITNPKIYQKMVQASSLYGDGHASQRIAHIIYSYLTNYLRPKNKRFSILRFKGVNVGKRESNR